MPKHKHTAIILLFLLLKIGLLSQNVFIKGLILSKDSIPVQYATIYDGSLKSGTFSDSLGRFSIIMPSNIKELHISAIGYKNKTITVGQNDNLSDFHIVLLNDTFYLKEVVISSKIFKPKQVVLGPRKKIKGYADLCGHSYSHEIGTYIPNHEQIHGEIKSIEVYLNNQSDETKHLLRLRIYSVDEALKPAKDMLFDNILLQVKKSKRDQLVKINLEKYNIPISSNGIVVAFESIHNTQKDNSNNLNGQHAGVDKCSDVKTVLIDDKTNIFIQWNRINKENWHNIDFANKYRQHGLKVTNLVPYVKLTINEYADQK